MDIPDVFIDIPLLVDIPDIFKDIPFCFSFLTSLKAADSSEEIFEVKDEKLEGETKDLLTHSINISTSSDAKGAALSVLEYQGGFSKGVETERFDCGSSFNFLFSLLYSKYCYFLCSRKKECDF